MNKFTTKSFLVVGLSVAVVVPSFAEMVKTSGQVCWMGERNSIATSKENAAFTYELDWIFTSDDRDPEKAVTGKCIGLVGIVSKKPDAVPNFCTHIGPDGSTYMSTGANEADGLTTRTYFGGTGKYEGIKGGSKGAATTNLKTSKGMFAGCRNFKGEYSVPG